MVTTPAEIFVKASMMATVDSLLHGKITCQRRDGDQDSGNFTNHDGFIDHVELTVYLHAHCRETGL